MKKEKTQNFSSDFFQLAYYQRIAKNTFINSTDINFFVYNHLDCCEKAVKTTFSVVVIFLIVLRAAQRDIFYTNLGQRDSQEMALNPSSVNFRV